jgi:tetratricopeptide (TPR) repeat protein
LEEEQPADESEITIITDDAVTWNISRNQVMMSPLEEPLSQLEIAEEDEAEAARQEKLRDIAGAQAFYARAIIEYEAAGWTELGLATLRMHRADLLFELKQYMEAISELDRAAHVYEAQAHDRRNKMLSAHLESAENAVDALILIGMIYLYSEQDAVQTRNVIERLLSLNALIKKRYERKVALLLYIAEFYFELGEHQEALTYFEQANRFYSQQLANIADFPHVAPITQHLGKLKRKLTDVKQTRTVHFTITTKTPDDLEAVLGELRKGHLAGVKVTKATTARRTSKDARSGIVYSANLSVSIKSGDDSSQE